METNDGQAARAETDILDDLEALDLAVSRVRTIGESMGLNPDDVEEVAQNSIVSLLTANAKNPHPFENWVVEKIDEAAKLGVEKALTAQEGAAQFADVQARLDLEERIASLEQSYGRELNSREIDDLAEWIRGDWTEWERRPSKGFHKYRMVSLDDPAVLYELKAYPAVSTHVGYAEQDDLEDEFEAGLIEDWEARLEVWNHLATSLGVPYAPAGLVSTERTAAARAVLAERGGAHAAAEQWLAGRRDVSDLLFAPWPFATADERVRVAELLAGRRRFADGLWSSAMGTAESDGVGEVPLLPASQFVPMDDPETFGFAFYPG